MQKVCSASISPKSTFPSLETTRGNTFLCHMFSGHKVTYIIYSVYKFVKKEAKSFYIVNLCTSNIKEFVAERKAQGHFFCLLHLEFQR